MPILLRGTLLTRSFLSCLLCSSFCIKSLKVCVSIGPGLMALTRILRCLRSTVHAGSNEGTSALLALYTLYPSTPVHADNDDFTTLAPPSLNKGTAFWTVNRSPLTLTLNVLSK